MGVLLAIMGILILCALFQAAHVVYEEIWDFLRWIAKTIWQGFLTFCYELGDATVEAVSWLWDRLRERLQNR